MFLINLTENDGESLPKVVSFGLNKLDFDAVAAAGFYIPYLEGHVMYFADQYRYSLLPGGVNLRFWNFDP